jgi:hypothetical protein
VDIVAPPPAVSRSTSFSLPPAVFTPGQVVDAQVLALLDAHTARLALADGVVDAHSTVPLQVGQTIRLEVKSSNAGLELVILTDGHGHAAAAPHTPGPFTLSQLPARVAAAAPATTATTTGAAVEGEGASAAAPERAVEITLSQRPPAATASPDAARAPWPAALTEAVGAAMRAAVVRQDGLAPLIANIEALVGRPDAAAALPPQVMQAARRLLDLRVPLGGDLSATDIRQALLQSGLFMEAQLSGRDGAAGATPAGVSSSGAAPTTPPGTAAPTGSPASPAASQPGDAGAAADGAGGDLKTALLVLRQVVRGWLDSSGSGEPAPAGPRSAPAQSPPSPPSAVPSPPLAGESAHPTFPPPPPYRGAAPAPQPAAAPSIAEDARPAEIAHKLLQQTDAAIARHALLQLASLPDTPSPSLPHAPDTSGPHWAFEIPFATPQGTNIAQFEVSRDGQAITPDGRTIWRARFTLDIEPIGPVHAQVAVFGERAAVTLWAERDATTARLRESMPMLSEGLREAELEPGDIHCRTGAPAAPKAPAGHFLDRAS